ncbi:MAG TPA: hypothetical protein VFW29_06985, partial [Solirubrobacteraceae bacterium]|nr:hypothetical protein [Solirubrobacteraceae bacterium]
GSPAAGDLPAPRAPAADPLIPVVFGLLVAACFAAFFLTQRLKHTPTAVQTFERSPTFSPRSPRVSDRQEKISFKLSSADAVTVEIVDSNLNVVATLLHDYAAPRYKQLSLRWNGRRGDARSYRVLVSATGHRFLLARTRGRLAPPGEYRVRVTLRHGGREVLSPWSFTLEAPRP